MTSVAREAQDAGAVGRDVRGQLNGHGMLAGASGEGRGKRGRFAGGRMSRGIAQQGARRAAVLEVLEV